ncbi:MAG TPA: hypothetical protein VLN73_03345 [Alphaproteobacteria bacterium]|nr:hypothetical protein [Alphaproteobacteria bacterium]
MNKTASNVLHRDDVISITGPLSDDRVAAIIETGANSEQVMEAFTWLSADEHLGPDPDHRLGGKVAEVYEILSEGRFLDEDEGDI